jgi:hypothetical protein
MFVGKAKSLPNLSSVSLWEDSQALG